MNLREPSSWFHPEAVHSGVEGVAVYPNGMVTGYLPGAGGPDLSLFLRTPVTTGDGVPLRVGAVHVGESGAPVARGRVLALHHYRTHCEPVAVVAASWDGWGLRLRGALVAGVGKRALEQVRHGRCVVDEHGGQVVGVVYCPPRGQDVAGRTL